MSAKGREGHADADVSVPSARAAFWEALGLDARSAECRMISSSQAITTTARSSSHFARCIVPIEMCPTFDFTLSSSTVTWEVGRLDGRVSAGHLVSRSDEDSGISF
jgi:hypothetical protein